MARAERQGFAIERVGQIGRVRSRMEIVESELLKGQHARLLERHEVRGIAKDVILVLLGFLIEDVVIWK